MERCPSPLPIQNGLPWSQGTKWFGYEFLSPLNYRLTMHFCWREFFCRNTLSDNHFFIHAGASVTIIWSWLSSGTLVTWLSLICFFSHWFSPVHSINNKPWKYLWQKDEPGRPPISISIWSDIHCNATSGSKYRCYFSNNDFYFPIKGWLRKRINRMYVKSWKKVFSTKFNHFESRVTL